MALADAVCFLKSHDDFLLSSHVNADGDAISSLLAMGSILSRLGKRHRIILHDKTPDPKFGFLPSFSSIENYYAGILNGEAVHSAILLDVPGFGRIGDVATLIEAGQSVEILNIDHHESNEGFGTVQFLDRHASSSAELVHRICEALQVTFDRALASQIYTGIMFDTGRFRHSNTSPSALRVCAEMVAFGAQPELIADAVYDEKSYDSVRILGKVLLTMERHFDDRVCLMFISGEDLHSGIDVDGYVDHGMAVAGVEVCVFFKEYQPNRHRLSLRSRGAVDVNGVASAFGGGGHLRAAGCFIDEPLSTARERLLEELGRHLKELRSTDPCIC